MGTRTKSEGPDRDPEPEPLKVGGSIRYGGFQSTVTRLGENGRLDLLYYELDRPRVVTSAAHGHGPGLWQTEAEFQAGRPLTELETVAKNRADGIRVPEVNARVVFGEPIGKMGFVHTRPTRAIITNVYSMMEVDLAILTPEPPEDPTAPDEPIRFVQNVKQAELAEEKQVRQGRPGHWDWPDGLIKEFGPIDKNEVFPPHRCGRCGAGMTRHAIVFYAKPEFRLGMFEVPSIKLCEPCNMLLRSFLGGTLPEPDPAVVSDGHGGFDLVPHPETPSEKAGLIATS